MGAFLSIPLLAVAAALQASLIPQIRLLGGGPDLVFLLVMSWAIDGAPEEGIIWAFTGGIMLDLLSYNPTGTSVLGMLVLVFLITGLQQRVYRVGIILLAGLVIVGTLFQQLVVMGVLTMSGFSIDWAIGLTYVVAPTILYNLVLIWPIYWLVRRLQRRLS